KATATNSPFCVFCAFLRQTRFGNRRDPAQSLWSPRRPRRGQGIIDGRLLIRPYSFTPQATSLMRSLFTCSVFVIAALSVLGLEASPALAQKQAAIDSVQKRDAEAWDLARQIWSWAEPGYQEKKSSEALSKMLEGAGFEVKRGVAEIPTAFTA